MKEGVELIPNVPAVIYECSQKWTSSWNMTNRVTLEKVEHSGRKFHFSKKQSKFLLCVELKLSIFLFTKFSKKCPLPLHLDLNNFFLVKKG
jgi:hypothetical protein